MFVYVYIHIESARTHTCSHRPTASVSFILSPSPTLSFVLAPTPSFSPFLFLLILPLLLSLSLSHPHINNTHTQPAARHEPCPLASRFGRGGGGGGGWDEQRSARDMCAQCIREGRLVERSMTAVDGCVVRGCGEEGLWACESALLSWRVCEVWLSLFSLARSPTLSHSHILSLALSGLSERVLSSQSFSLFQSFIFSLSLAAYLSFALSDSRSLFCFRSFFLPFAHSLSVSLLRKLSFFLVSILSCSFARTLSLSFLVSYRMISLYLFLFHTLSLAPASMQARETGWLLCNRQTRGYVKSSQALNACAHVQVHDCGDGFSRQVTGGVVSHGPVAHE